MYEYIIFLVGQKNTNTNNRKKLFLFSIYPSAGEMALPGIFGKLI